MISLENLRIAYIINTRGGNVSRLLRLRQLTNKISTRPRVHALAQANNDCGTNTPGRLILFSDASASQRRNAIGIAWKANLTSSQWQCKHQVVPSYLDTDSAEFCGVIQAFTIAAKICAEREGTTEQYDTVAIYTDSQTAIGRLERLHLPGSRGKWALEKLFVPTMLDKTIRELTEAKVAIELHWCPGHAGVTGNELADKVCVAARKGMAKRGVVQTLSLGAQSLGPKLDGLKKQVKLLVSTGNKQRTERQSPPNTTISTTTDGLWTSLTKWIAGFGGSKQADVAEAPVKRARLR